MSQPGPLAPDLGQRDRSPLGGPRPGRLRRAVVAGAAALCLVGSLGGCGHAGGATAPSPTVNRTPQGLSADRLVAALDRTEIDGHRLQASELPGRAVVSLPAGVSASPAQCGSGIAGPEGTVQVSARVGDVGIAVVETPTVDQATTLLAAYHRRATTCRRYTLTAAGGRSTVSAEKVPVGTNLLQPLALSLTTTTGSTVTRATSLQGRTGAVIIAVTSATGSTPLGDLVSIAHGVRDSVQRA